MSDWQEIGDRVYRKRYAALRFNVGVVLGDEGALLIETRGSPVQARELIEDLRQLTSLPVRWVVNTHYHWDHTWGNQLFRPAPIWGHVECRAEMLKQDRSVIESVANTFPEMRGEFQGMEVVPPDQVFPGAAVIDVGGREVRLHYLGLGHTNSDIVARVPDAGVVFAGDLIEEGAPPYFDDSFPLEWPGTVQRLLEFVSDPVVPGHGEAVDRAFVEAQVKELELVAKLARECSEGQLSLQDAVRKGPYPERVMRAALRRAGVS